MDRVAIVVLTWNYRAYTLACLRSLAAQHFPHSVYVVDNASTDDTPAVVAAAFPAVRVIANAENLGFAAGNTIGLAAAFAEGADAVLVLNNDTTLEPDALTALVSAMRAHTEVGIFSPLILFADAPHHVWFAGATVSKWTGQDTHLGYDQEYDAERFSSPPMERAAGCAMLITRTCYERIGGFDADLFMYFEDVEYSLRARKAGFGILLVPQSVVYHHVSVSTGGAKTANGVYYMLRNGITVIERYFPRAWPLMALRRSIMLLAMIRFICMKPRAIGRIGDVIAGFRDAWCARLGPRAGTPRVVMPSRQ